MFCRDFFVIVSLVVARLYSLNPWLIRSLESHRYYGGIFAVTPLRI